jgi:class 3 adenylate cyclase/tetratricopeptide (TPR) repeat protein
VTCPRCQADNRDGARFCRECGAPFAADCPSCGAKVEVDSKFCDRCGAAMAAAPAPTATASRFSSPGSYTPKHLAERILTSKSALEGERKQVTVLFCDIVDSTATAERLGPEAMHRLLSGFFEIALAEIHRYEGTANQFLGDGFMALFGAPLAHEDHARRAVLAALAIQRSLQDAFGASPTPLAIRMGINTGFVVVGSIGDDLRMDYTAVGDTTHLAARLQQLAPSGAIFVGETTARQVSGYVSLAALDPMAIKGLGAAVPVYRVEGLGRRRSPLDGIDERELTPFVGRDRELAALVDLLAQVEAGEGRVVGIVGEPGAGKSRLLLEFRRRIAERPLTFLEGRCLSFGGSIPYLPILDIIRNNCGIGESDTPETTAEKVQRGLEEIGLDGAESAPYLLHLLGVRDGLERLGGLSAQAIKAGTFETLRQMALHGSAQRPLVFAIEDVHWIDRTSQEFLESLAESLSGARILAIVTFRPGYRLPWFDHSYATQLSLSRLAPAASLSVVRAVLTRDRMSQPLAELILDKAEGNPLFLEEMARAVAEDGGADKLAVPDTINGILSARIDRLPPDAKRLLQTASVLGREFSPRLLSAVWDGRAFDPHLAELKRMEFLYERSAGGGEPVYVFKHALTEDVAYGSLLRSRRQALHAAAGRALETLYAGRLEDVSERLAHHYVRADDAEKAVEYLVASADKAARIYANADAVTLLEQALVHAERLPADTRHRSILTIVLRMAHSLYFLARLGDTLDLLLRHRDEVEHLHDAALAGQFHFWLGHTYSYLSRNDDAREAAYRALDQAGRAGDEATLGKAHYLIARIGFGSCHFVEGISHGGRAIELLDKTGEVFWLGQAYWAIGINHFFRGDFHEALEAEARARSFGEMQGDVRLQTYADWATGWIYALVGECEAGIDACQRSLDRSRDNINGLVARGMMGVAHLEKGDLPQAIPAIEGAAEGFRKIGYGNMVAYLDGQLGDALTSMGEFDRARSVLKEALDVAAKVQFPLGTAYALRALGRIAMRQGNLGEAEALFGKSFETFADVGALFEAARARLDLAGLAHQRGDLTNAVEHIASARTAFFERRLPRHVERAERLAAELGLPLPPAVRGA